MLHFKLYFIATALVIAGAIPTFAVSTLDFERVFVSSIDSSNYQATSLNFAEKKTSTTPGTKPSSSPDILGRWSSPLFWQALKKFPDFEDRLFSWQQKADLKIATQEVWQQAQWKLLGDLEGSHLLVKITNPERGIKMVLKIGAQSKVSWGEYIAAQIAMNFKIFDFVPTQLILLNSEDKTRIRQLIEERAQKVDPKNAQISSQTHLKENINEALILKQQQIEQLTQMLNQPNEPIWGVLKPWVENLQYTQQLGELERWERDGLQGYFNTPSPEKTIVTLRQCAHFTGNVNGCVNADIPSFELIKQMSAIVWVDLLTGNVDRFPGANLHFRRVGPILAQKLANQEWYYPQIRLTALDNGGSLVAKNNQFILEQLLSFSNPKFTWFSKYRVEHLQLITQLPHSELEAWLGLKDLPIISGERRKLVRTLLSNAQSLLQRLKLLDQKGQILWLENYFSPQLSVSR